MELKNIERGRIREYAEKYGVKNVEGAKPWFEKADIATPCATQNEINEEAAKALVANGVIAITEGANMPTTPEAIKVFQEAKVLYCPGKTYIAYNSLRDFLCIGNSARNYMQCKLRVCQDSILINMSL